MCPSFLIAVGSSAVDVALPGRLLARTIQSDVGEQMIRQSVERWLARARSGPQMPPEAEHQLQQGWQSQAAFAGTHRGSRRAHWWSPRNPVGHPRSDPEM